MGKSKNKATAKAPAAPAAEAPAKAPAKASEHKVAAGKSITSKRGVLDAGTVVTAKDFVGGDKAIEMLRSKGLVV